MGGWTSWESLCANIVLSGGSRRANIWFAFMNGYYGSSGPSAIAAAATLCFFQLTNYHVEGSKNPFGLGLLV